MNQVQRDQLGQLITATAIYYRQDVPKSVISMYIDDLIDSGILFDDAMAGYKAYRRNPKNTRFPIPSNIIEIANPKLSIESEAQMAAARVYEAITRFGYCNGKEAKVFIGSLGWEAVKRFGGWQVVCEIVGVSYDKSTFLAHVRNQIKAEIETRNTSTNNFPQLEVTPRPDRLESLVHPNTISEPKIIPNDLLNSMLKVKTMP